jgi:hypothetical protein
MKKLLVVAAIATAASPAFASKARTAALGQSPQLTDVQYVFEAPYDLGEVGEMVTIEWGATDPTPDTKPHAEGGFIKKHNEMWYGLYLGRQSVDFNTAVTRAGTAAFGSTTGLLREQNPINLMAASKMGDLTWGVNFKYAKGFNETVAGKAKSELMGLAAGVSGGAWSVALVQGLTGKTENAAGTEVKSKNNSKIAFDYDMSDSLYVFADYKMTETSFEGGTVNNVKGTIMNVGLVNTLVKADGINFFYGVAYNSTEAKPNTGSKNTITGLPVWLGVEADATSWMVLRSSIKQNILINENKGENFTATNKKDVASTEMAAGLGFKLGKGMLDATFTTATSGSLSFGGDTDGAGGDDSFLSQVSYTYMF